MSDHVKYFCFACGASIEGGEPFVCVSRLWHTYKDGQAKEKIIDAIASLQVCIPCTLRASDHDLTWTSLPKLVDEEILGFYNYTQQLACVINRRFSDTKQDKELLKDALLIKELCGIRFPDPLAIMGGTHMQAPIPLIEPTQCSGCYHAMDFNLPYMEIEIAINIPTPSVIDLLNTFTAAQYCSACSSSLFPINNNGRMGYSIY